MKLKNKTCRQHTFGAIANFVVNSRSRFARNIILVENNQFRSSQPRQAPERQAVNLPSFSFKNS